MSQATDSSTAFSLSKRACRATDQPISYLMSQALANPNLISLAAGLVDYETLPIAEVRDLFQSMLAESAAARSALQYGTTNGFEPLRAALYEHLAQLDGLDADAYPGSADELIVSTGSQQLLHLLTDVLVDPGPPPDIVITAWPSYFVYTGALGSAGATVRSVDVDE